MRVASAVLGVAVSLMIVGGAFGFEKGKSGKEERKRREGPVSQVVERIKKFVLSDEQKTKLAELEKEYAPKIKEAKQKANLDNVLTDDQKKARDDARKAAKDAGKNHKEIEQAGKAAAKLTKEQKSQLANARKEATSLRKELDQKAVALLTPEQKDLLEKERKSRSKSASDGK
jgi:hypothetical protein